MDTSQNTSAEGAAVGAAVGAISVWLIETLGSVDVPTLIEGSILIVATYLVARLLPPR